MSVKVLMRIAVAEEGRRFRTSGVNWLSVLELGARSHFIMVLRKSVMYINLYTVVCIGMVYTYGNSCHRNY
ncbi:MAG: hypothetical protein J7J99_00845 [Thermoprotei archaeon]|nr:hypothetical protein [Thermoprotei archaeon]